jgi:hypothetical protein
MRVVKVIPVVVGALGAVSGRINKWLDELECGIGIDCIQKTALLGSARILRRTLNT